MHIEDSTGIHQLESLVPSVPYSAISHWSSRRNNNEVGGTMWLRNSTAESSGYAKIAHRIGGF